MFKNFLFSEFKKEGDVMAKRKKMPKRKDQQIFKRTATATRKINLSPSVMRGGIRL